jgi:hypothetical protein
VTVLTKREALVQAVTEIVGAERGLLTVVLERLEAVEAKHRRFLELATSRAKSDGETIASQRATIVRLEADIDELVERLQAAKRGESKVGTDAA